MPTTLPALDRLVAQARELYSLPRVAAEVLELTRDPQVDAKRLKACIENDPALAGKVLRVVNSSLFGLSRNVRDLNQALALLGTTPLKLLVLGFCLPEGLFRGLGADFLAAYWRRTLVTAVSARQVAEEIWKISGDEAFLAGLLREVGLLVLLQDCGEAYIRFHQRVRQLGGDLLAAERDALGFDHAELTSELLTSWNLPETLVAAARMPRDDEQFRRLPPTKRALPRILRLADTFTELLAEGRVERLPDLLSAEQWPEELPAPELDAFVDRLEAKVEQLAEILALDLPRGQKYRDVLQEAHDRLRGLATAAAEELAGQGQPRDLEVELYDDARSLAAAMQLPLSSSALANSPRSLARRLVADADAKLHLPPSYSPRSTGPRCDPTQDEGLLARVATAAAKCRDRRQPLSLLLVEIDQYEQLVFTAGQPAAERMLAQINAVYRRLDLTQPIRVDLDDGLLAILLPGTDRLDAARAGTEWLAAVKSWPAGRTGQPDPPRLNIGIASAALPAKNFSAKELVQAAQRCLSAARHGGGQGVKSIEV